MAPLGIKDDATGIPLAALCTTTVVDRFALAPYSGCPPPASVPLLRKVSAKKNKRLRSRFVDRRTKRCIMSCQNIIFCDGLIILDAGAVRRAVYKCMGVFAPHHLHTQHPVGGSAGISACGKELSNHSTVRRAYASMRLLNNACDMPIYDAAVWSAFGVAAARRCRRAGAVPNDNVPPACHGLVMLLSTGLCGTVKSFPISVLRG